MSAGAVTLSNRTKLAGNARTGASAYATGGVLAYLLPAPLGTWIASSHFLDPTAGLYALEDAFPFACAVRGTALALC